MSLGQVLFMGLIVAPTVILGIAFFVLTALLVVSFILDMTGFSMDDLMCAIFAILLSLFFAWFVFGCPGLEEQRVPHAVEGREEWVDLCYGTTYSQVERERRTDD